MTMIDCLIVLPLYLSIIIFVVLRKMFKTTIRVFQVINRTPSYFMSESKLALKRDGEAKLAQKIKESIDTTYIKVKDITIGSSPCIIEVIQVVKCTT